MLYKGKCEDFYFKLFVNSHQTCFSLLKILEPLVPQPCSKVVAWVILSCSKGVVDGFIKMAILRSILWVLYFVSMLGFLCYVAYAGASPEYEKPYHTGDSMTESLRAKDKARSMAYHTMTVLSDMDSSEGYV